jgi:hypothetical protein
MRQRCSIPPPDRNKIPERIGTRALVRKLCERAGNPCVICDLLTIATMPCGPKNDRPSNTCKQ